MIGLREMSDQVIQAKYAFWMTVFYVYLIGWISWLARKSWRLVKLFNMVKTRLHER